MATEAHLAKAAMTVRARHPRFRRHWLIASAAAGLTVVLAGCGTVGSAAPAKKSPAPLSVVLTAYTHTIGARTAKVALNETVSESVKGSTKRVSVSGTGAVDFSSQNGEYSFSDPTVGTFAVRFISPELYLQLPSGLRSQLPTGKSWAEIDLNTVAESKLGESLSQLSDSSQASTQTLSYLQAVSSTGITTVGSRTIRGAATTEYKASIDLTKVAAQKSPQEQAAVQTLETELHTSTMPVQVWLDAQGLVRQIAYQLNLTSATSTSVSMGSTNATTPSSFTATIDYYDFGAAVNVSAPPAGQVDNVTSQALAASTTTTVGG
jgi:hypothetical protein